MKLKETLENAGSSLVKVFGTYDCACDGFVYKSKLDVAWCVLKEVPETLMNCDVELIKPHIYSKGIAIDIVILIDSDKEF